MPKPVARSAELIPRTLHALMPPWALVLVVGLYIANVSLAFYIGSGDPVFRERLASLVLTSILMLGLMFWNICKFMRTSRGDPFEADDDFWAYARRWTWLFVCAVGFAGCLNLIGLVTRNTIRPIQDETFSPLAVSLLLLLIQMIFIMEMRWLRSRPDRKNYNMYRPVPVDQTSGS
ncbi:MAG: hypothetical protein QF921_16185 [Pseudomonadales bacterium]|jgi:4-amino-4-deoxy-L-arabinose transferase-like glycosyltransferase|nr:hypothetical protein [Pseudomonadales bacterium]MDP6470769.1 hypothetical protein [Pseudomonadales bacterium]MDP6828279.1 hypothetical protein [Pseudomonadales bacterium]MDP6973023.1 hypothetical protein [Pseudomonadales bacterium]|tara:strand:- start:46 stop:573 length:528 start_codon:yes stop_codon:yes gene_type:complete